MVQHEAFLPELQALEKGYLLPNNSKLSSYSPYLDNVEIIRVGGRLVHAEIPESQKHPMILPAKHFMTELIMKKEHLRLHHCGVEQLLYIVRQKYWILRGRREARKTNRRCLKCFKARPRSTEILMGDLPDTGSVTK